MPQNHKKYLAAGGSALQASFVIRLSYINLFSTGPKLDYFLAKKMHWFKPPTSLSKILVALLVAFTAADRFFKRLYRPHTKRVKKRCRPYKSLFLDMNTKFLKYRKIWSRKILVFMFKSSVYSSAPITFY